MLQICVAKEKQRQLAVLILTEDKMSVWKTRDSSDTIVSMAMDGVTICAALTSEYIMYNMDQMTATPLFPLDPGIGFLPNILRIERDEFLVLGPGNLGMFVTGVGVAGRPPVQWSGPVSHVTYAAPHLVCQGQELLWIHDISAASDQAVKQTLSYPGARFVGHYDGHIMVASSGTIDTLRPVPLQKQAESLLEAGKLEEAVSLARDNSDGDLVRQKAGFSYLKQGNMERARELLLLGKTDVREILSLYPGMLPANSKFVRDPSLHDIPDVSCIKKEGTEMSPDEFLLNYLQSLMAESGAYLDHCIEVHTAFIKILTRADPSQVTQVIQDDNTILDLDELTEFFESTFKSYHFLATLNWKFNNKEAAIDTWVKIVSGDLRDEHFDGLKKFCHHLGQCSDELLFKHCDIVLVKDQEMGSNLFMKPDINIQDNCKFVETALNILARYPSAKVQFLKHLVFERDSQEEKHHTQLALAFINALRSDESPSLKADLSKLILTSAHLNANFLLQQIADTGLDYEKAILHGKLGEHQKALDILVNKLEDYKLAEGYCDDLSLAKPDLKSTLLFTLLSIYLNPTSETNKEKFTTLAVDLINTRAEDLNGCQVLPVLPEHWNIAIILPALATFSRKSLHSRRMTSVKKNLHKAQYIHLREKLIEAESVPIYVKPNHYCAVSQKRFTAGEPIVRYPNGILIRKEVMVSDNICPVTGEVFNIE